MINWNLRFKWPIFYIFWKIKKIYVNFDLKVFILNMIFIDFLYIKMVFGKN